MSLDYAEIDLCRAFTHGMGYVALSRVRTLNGIKLMGLNEMSLVVNPTIREFDLELRKSSEEAKENLNHLAYLRKKNYLRYF